MILDLWNEKLSCAINPQIFFHRPLNSKFLCSSNNLRKPGGIEANRGWNLYFRLIYFQSSNKNSTQ